jgi:hypothetical protein
LSQFLGSRAQAHGKKRRGMLALELERAILYNIEPGKYILNPMIFA